METETDIANYHLKNIIMVRKRNVLKVKRANKPGIKTFAYFAITKWVSSVSTLMMILLVCHLRFTRKKT